MKELMLNDEDTEAIICGSKASQLKVSVDSVYIGWSVIPLSNSVRDQGFFLDKNHVDDKSHKFNCKVMFLLCALLGQTTSVPEQKNCKCNCCATRPVKVGLLQQLFVGHAKKTANETTVQ